MTPETLGRALMASTADVVVPVRFGGRRADGGGIARVARGAIVIEDACHAIGAEVRSSHGWSKVGSCSDSLAAVFSFHPVKPITTGEGGAIVTQDGTLARRLKMLRSNGMVH